MYAQLAKGSHVLVGIFLFFGLTLSAVAAEYTNASEYLQVELGLTEEEAEHRLAGERTAARVRQYAIELLGERYAGSWFEPELNAPVVATVDESDFAFIDALGGVPTLHDHSLSMLRERQRLLEAYSKHSDTIAAGLVAWYVDVVENSVVVEHLPESREAAELIVSQLGIDDVPVRFDSVGEFPVFTYDIRGGDESDNTSLGFSCSIGFSITDGYIIAGHCGSTNNSVSGYNHCCPTNFHASTKACCGLGGPGSGGLASSSSIRGLRSNRLS